MVHPRRFCLVCCLLLLALPALAGVGEVATKVDGVEFATWQDYFESDFFKASGNRCKTPDRATREMLYGRGGSASDCSQGATNPTSDYDTTYFYDVPVVFHIIMTDDCNTGVISDALINSQMEILNEDFQAILGTNGEDGADVGVRFTLATTDPDGNPTTGITRDCNTTWFNDGGGYWNTLAWDPNRYLNIYTNNASGALGYVPFLPADGGGGSVGQLFDRVVLLWNTVGRNAPGGPPYNLGRTGTHELGHYFGLEHTFSGGCASGTPPACYTSGDLICDTNSEASPNFSACTVGTRSTCGSVDPIDNYMDYSDDICMRRFTQEQSRRMRCTLEFYRTGFPSSGGDPLPIFSDGFESGNTSAWSVTQG